MSGSRDSIAALAEDGFCILKARLRAELIEACRVAFWPILMDYVERHPPNRGPHRYFVPVPFDPPCFAPEFFFHDSILGVVRGAMDDRVVADQWGCEVPLRGSTYQEPHVDYRRPLFDTLPDLVLPPYILVVHFGLARITREDGPIEIAPGTHRMPREEALRAVDAGEVPMRAIVLEVGDVLIRHPWALHRGTPNVTDRPRAMAGIRYVRRWYTDDSREVETIPQAVWEGLTAEQRAGMRFSVKK